MEMQELSLEKFEEASEIVKKVTQETKLIYSEYFSERYGNKIYFKPENMQRTGAYKVRGAYYKISQLTPEERSRGLITASAGNHAQGVAYAAKLAGVKATVVMPVSTPLIKVNRTKSYGAEVVLYGNVFDEACAHAYELADEHGYTFVHPFNDLEVATGQGSIAMEIIKEDFKITQEHGQFFEKNGIQMMALYHPAALLRDPRKKPETFEDLKRLQAKIQEICDHTALTFE